LAEKSEEKDQFETLNPTYEDNINLYLEILINVTQVWAVNSSI